MELKKLNLEVGALKKGSGRGKKEGRYKEKRGRWT